MTTFYDVLGISLNANDEEITNAYHTKSQFFHPIKTQETKEDKKKTKAYISTLNQAYTTLIDPLKRAVYDELLHQNESKSYKDSEKWELSYSGSYKFETRRKLVTYSYVLKSFDEEDNPLEEQPKLLIALDSLFSSLEDFKQLIYGLQDKAIRNPKYQILAIEMQELYDCVSKKIRSLQFQSEQFNVHDKRYSGVESSILLNTLVECQNDFKGFQNQHQELLNSHRSTLRNTPLVREILMCLDALSNILSNIIIFLVNTSKDKGSKLAYYGMFQPPKTKTAEELNELANDIDAHIESMSPGHI
ncbi:hypothetical protein ELY21_05170 [Legionella sp. km535]|uniref:J domain-containing protein n=1 Tax=Legionella sp. km535 TaxID=2498107 RepID=UPI000F8F43EE|nr:DnaJ domain-containing protein [Legionella sp. km535]RUR19271.1 hypothetical protein ELY21_05170 [Legionella sp. km535]